MFYVNCEVLVHQQFDRKESKNNKLTSEICRPIQMLPMQFPSVRKRKSTTGCHTHHCPCCHSDNGSAQARPAIINYQSPETCRVADNSIVRILFSVLQRICTDNKYDSLHSSCSAVLIGRIQAWAHEIFIFRTKRIEISGHFSGHRSHKKRVFCHLGRI